ncbi:hypothetical protein N9R54_05405 [Pelobium sp.]|nr:hypothetical protein [Pelobium sp.]MDA9555656.1 hypothetical protein [Pelobium sp.]
MKHDFKDEDLDLFFRSKAQKDGEEPLFNEVAWADMERRLDQRDRKIFFFYLSAASVFIATLALGWLFISKNENESSKIYALKKNNKSEFHNPAYQLEKSKTNIAQNTSNNKTEGVVTPFEIKSATESQKGKNRLFSKNIKNTSNPSINNQTLENKSFIEDSDRIANKTDLVLLPEKNSSNDTENMVIKPILVQNTLATQSEKKSVKLFKNINWSLGFAVGPTFNTTSGVNQSTGDLNGGVFLSAKLNRLKITTGANYGIKDYNTSSLSYNNIRPSLVDKISNINASCNILEVPVSLSYQLLKFKKSSIDINAGLSSYFMLKEQYKFEYLPSSGYNDYSFTRINRNQHYFKVLHLSSTYYLPIKKSSYNFGIEPYAKLPLAGVGEGKVALKSYGLNLLFNYQFKKK